MAPWNWRNCFRVLLPACFTLPGHGTHAASPEVPGDAISLPAFVVEGSEGRRPGIPVHWYHVDLPGLEILSCYPEAVTHQWVNAISEQLQLLAWELPPELYPKAGRPLVVILDARPFAPLRLSLPALGDRSSLARRGGQVAGAAITDWDFASQYLKPLPPSPAAAAQLTSAASTAIFAQHPGWEGIESVLMRARFNVYAVSNGADLDQPPSALKEKDLPLPSLADLFSPVAPPPVGAKPTASLDEGGLWLGRWALFADEGIHQPALWKWAGKVMARPRFDESLSQDCFGLSLAELDQRVARFRQRSQATRLVHFKLRRVPAVPPAQVRDASEEEIACALLQWTLLTGRQLPGLREMLREASRRVLDRARKENAETPRVIALAGLIELAAGNLPEAQRLLESVAAFPGLDRGARLELAKLRYTEIIARAETKSPTLSRAQVDLIVSPLAPFLAGPSQADALALILQAWVRGAENPAQADLRLLAARAADFPRDHELLFQAATLCDRQHLPAEAAKLAALGLENVTTEEHRVLFEGLSRRIQANP